MRLANAAKIRSIDWARSGIDGTGSLTPRARRTLAVYVILVKMEFGGVAAPMGAIADAVFRSSHGEAGSIRTLQRAHRELEERGFIRMIEFRRGERSKGAVIYFNLSAFSWWTRDQIKNVCPFPTQSHNVVSRETMCDSVPHATSCHPSDRRTDNTRVNTPKISPSSYKEPRAGARANNSKSSARKNPVLFSVGVVLGAMRLHRADRRAARARAEIETKADVAGVAIINHSGIDWAYWSRRWEEMPIAVRESTARREIIPLLLGEHPTEERHELEELPKACAEVDSADRPTATDIAAVRMTLEAKFSLPRLIPLIPRDEPTKATDLSDYDLKILLAARERCRAANS